MNLSIDQWIASAASFGTLIAAIMAAFSIREIRRQGAIQTRPNLTLSGGLFEIKATSNGWWWEPPADEPNVKEYGLTLLNVGNGIAKGISVSWNFDAKKMVEVINDLSIRRGASIGVVRDNFGYQFLERGNVVSGARTPENSGQTIDFVLPVAHGNANSLLSLPPSLKSMLLIYYGTLLAPGKNLDERLKNTPSLPNTATATLTYQDASERTFSKRFLTSIRVVYLDTQKNVLALGFSPVAADDKPLWRIVSSRIAESVLDATTSEITLSIGLRGWAELLGTVVKSLRR